MDRTNYDEELAIILTTIPEMDVQTGETDLAASISHKLVSEKIVACVNTLTPVSSTYLWKGKVCTSKERLLIIKMLNSKIDRVEARLQELHPYKVFEFLVLPNSYTSRPYLKWVIESCQLVENQDMSKNKKLGF